MYSLSSHQNPFPKSMINSFPQLPFQPSTNQKSNDTSLKLLLTNLLNHNEDLQNQLQHEKQKNYSLMEHKRKLENDIQKLQYEIQQIHTQQNLNLKEIQVKKYQINSNNNKLQIQLDQYLEQNKKIRGDLRKWIYQCQQLTKQKDNLINQNFYLIKQINDLKITESNVINQISTLKSITSNRNIYHSNPNQFPTTTTIKQPINPQKQPFTKQNTSILTSHSPPKLTINYKYHRNNQITTNPSQNKISLSQQKIINSQKSINDQFQHISQHLNEQTLSPIHQSINPKTIQQYPHLFSPTKIKPPINIQHNPNPNFTPSPHHTLINKSPSVMTYDNRQTPILQPLKFNPLMGTNNDNHITEDHQKKQLKNQVMVLRNQLIDTLLTQYYTTAINKAQQDKTNSLKIFIESLSPKLDILVQMVKNYLSAKQLMSQTCPSLRLSYQPNTPQPHLSPHSHQFLITNTQNLSNIYQSIKQNSKNQQTQPGQYLTLFRYLTLLHKLEEEVDPLLIDSIKHSTLQQIQVIKKYRLGGIYA